MKYLEIVHKDFMGEQSHKVSDISTARHYLNAWFMSSRKAADHMGLPYQSIKQYVLHKSTDSDDVKDWTGFDGKTFEETTDGLDLLFLAFREEACSPILTALKPYGLEPEMREIFLATIQQPQAMFGLMVAFDRNSREKLSVSLKSYADFFHYSSGNSLTKNRTDHDVESVVRVIESVCIKVRWPMSQVIYNRNLKEFAKVKA